MGNDNYHHLYCISSLYCNNQNRLSHDNGVIWAEEISESSGHLQNNLKPTLLAAISYYDVQNWIDNKIRAFRSTVSSMINQVVNSAKWALQSSINAVSSTARDAYNKASSLAYTISSSVSNALSQAKSYADSAVRAAKSGLDYAINSVRSTASSAYNKAVEVANSVGGKISSAISTAKSYADSAVNSAKSVLNSAINAAKSTANDALSVAQSVGIRFGLFEMNFQRTLSDKFKFFTDFISGINKKINDVVEPLLKPFKDFAKGINSTVMNIINPIIKPLQDAFNGITNTVNKAVEIAVKPFNDFIKGFNDKINGLLKPILDKINNLPKELLKQALQQAKEHFKSILDNFKNGIDTIKATINGILSNINTLNSFKTDTNNRLINLENSINNLGRLYVTQTSFNSFKSDVDKRIKLLNTSVSSINADINAAFQQFNLTLIDGFNRTVDALNKVDNMEAWRSVRDLGNAMKSINSMLDKALSAIYLRQDEILNAIKDINSDSWLNKFAKFIESATLMSKLDGIKNSIDKLGKGDIFDSWAYKVLEKWFTAEKINKLADDLDDIHELLKIHLVKLAAAPEYWTKKVLAELLKIIGFNEDILKKFDDLIKTVKEIELPGEENNTIVNKEAETNIWDVAKELLKTLQEFIKNPSKLVELLIGFIKDLIVPYDINFFSDFRSEVSTKFDKKLPFVGQFKNSFVAAFNSPKTFNDYTLSYNFLKFSGSVVVPIHYLNDLGAIAKPYITAFLVFGFLITMYSWFLNRGAKLNDD